jgi:hypothetical protein
MVTECVLLEVRPGFWTGQASDSNAETVPKFQVATACFSCSPPDFKLQNYPPLWMPPI